MKNIILVMAVMAFAVSSEAADVGVSVRVGQPGFYGSIDIGNFPRPRLVYPEAVIITSSPVASQPLYMHVPPGHQKKWKKHCHEYKACDRPVYFVSDQWYNDVYVPEYKARHGQGGGGRGKGQGGEGRGKGQGKEQGKGKD